MTQSGSMEGEMYGHSSNKIYNTGTENNKNEKRKEYKYLYTLLPVMLTGLY
jgi:hypothetical protein